MEMANNPIDMSKVRKVLMMHFQGKSKKFISKYLSLSRNTVKKYITTSQLLGLNEDFIRSKSDLELEAIFVKDNEIKVCDKLLKAHEFFPSMERELKKTGVTKANRYEPVLNKDFEDFAEHYGTTILPARAYKPKDKALAEGAVKILYQRIYSHLHNQTFFSLKELNEAIRVLLEKHNKTLLTGRLYSRLDLFNEIEEKELPALAVERFEIKEIEHGTVIKNSHVMLKKDKHYYSVPFQYIQKKVKIEFTSDTVVIHYKYNRIATHKRSYNQFNYTTLPQHLPSTHQYLSDWNPQKFINWANNIDPTVGRFITFLLENKKHPEQAYKSCIGVLSMEKKVGRERLINACKRALEYGIYNYKIIEKILTRGLDKYTEHQNDNKELPSHENIRGEDYYQ